jgi:hypothetical protein
MSPAGKSERLRLRAEDAEDLTVLSACLQDALVAVRDIAYLPEERRLILVANRFRWEGGEGQGERVLCGVAIDLVRAVRQQGIDRGRPGALLSILALRPVAGAVEIQFASRAALRAEVDRLLVHIEDIREPYPTAWRPSHKLDDPAAGTS